MPPQALSPNQIVWVEETCLTLAQASACASGTSRALVTISRINLYLAPSAPCASRAPNRQVGGSKIDFASYPTFMSAV